MRVFFILFIRLWSIAFPDLKRLSFIESDFNYSVAESYSLFSEDEIASVRVNLSPGGPGYLSASAERESRSLSSLSASFLAYFAIVIMEVLTDIDKTSVRVANVLECFCSELCHLLSSKNGSIRRLAYRLVLRYLSTRPRYVLCNNYCLHLSRFQGRSGASYQRTLNASILPSPR